MNILQKRTGKFHFLDEEYNLHKFTNYDEVPEDLHIKEIVAFLPDIPPPPHTVQQHEEIHAWNLEFKRLAEMIYAPSN